MKTLVLVIALVLAVSTAFAGAITDSLGLIRAFGDQSSWFSSCFVVGDGGWAVTSWDAITEKTGPDASQTVRNPIFISLYTGQAVECEVKASNKELNIALIKLPLKGLPAATFAKKEDFTKAPYGTMGQLMSGEPVGSKWQTELYGVTREQVGETYKLAAGTWGSAKTFVTDIGKYRWIFLSNISPEKSVPNGSIVARGSNVIGMYLNRLVITTGENRVSFGRCAMSTEIVKWLGANGVDSATLANPSLPNVEADPSADAAFQLQAKLYSAISSGRFDRSLENISALIKLRPSDAQPLMLQGVALTATGKFEEALKAYDEAAKLDPKLSGLGTNRALALVGLKKKTEAEAELLKVYAQSPSDVRNLTALADLYYADENSLDKAYDYAKKASLAAPGSPAAHLVIAKVEKRRKNVQEAINEIGIALKMAPNWGEAWYAMGVSFEEGGDNEKAEKAYRTLVEKQPKNPASILTLASFLVDQGKKDEALELISRIKDLNPSKEILDAAKALAEKPEKKEAVTK